MGRNVTLKPMIVSQNWTLPMRSLMKRPVILGNQ